VSDWFDDALRAFPRLAISGRPKSGKTTLSERVSDRPVIHGDDYIKLGWSECSQKIVDVAAQIRGPLLIEGVQVPRALRKGLQVDAVIWLDKRLGEYNRHHETMLEGMLTVFTEWRHANPKIPVLIPAPVKIINALPKQIYPAQEN